MNPGTGNPIETNLRVLKTMNAQRPNTVRNVHKYLEKNMYSRFSLRVSIFNEAGEKVAIRDLIIQACQYDKRNKDYLDDFSRLMYRILPDFWYRRDKSWFD